MKNLDNGDIERMGVATCEKVFSEMGFIFREQPIRDYGIDAIVETKSDGYPSGKMIGIQIKSGSSYFSEAKDDCIVFRGKKKHYYYWKNYSLPVIIVLYNPKTESCIW